MKGQNERLTKYNYNGKQNVMKLIGAILLQDIQRRGSGSFWAKRSKHHTII